MSVYELIDIADRFERLNKEAVKFGWTLEQLMKEIKECALDFRYEADALADSIAASNGPHETDLWYDTSKELA